jgi:hypothetical protein
MNQLVGSVRLPGILNSTLAGAIGESSFPESGQRQQRIDLFEALLARSNRSISADGQERLLDDNASGALDKRFR